MQNRKIRITKGDRMLESLEVWKFGGIKRRLSQSFTCADFIFLQASKLQSFQTSECNCKAIAFTMAEILISLTIIGVIAAITLPALQANINEKTWTTQRKALYSRMSQAISMMDSLNGYGIGETEQETASKATQAFITDGLSKVLKIQNICENTNYAKCGFPGKIIKMGINSKIDTPLTLVDLNGLFNGSYENVEYYQVNTNSAAFETANGESILTFYNPNCSYTYGVNQQNGAQDLLQPTMCANFIYDLNGKKGPNKVGKDIGFMTAFYPSDTEFVAPMPAGQPLIVEKDKPFPTFTVSTGNASCRNIYGKDAKMANIEELKSVFVNNKLGYRSKALPGFIMGNVFRSSSVSSENMMYGLAGYKGSIGLMNIGYSTGGYAYIICVKR